MNIHEDLTRHEETTSSSDRSFGLVFAGFFALVGLAPLIRGHSIRVWALGLCAVFLSVALIRPRVLGPLNRVWTALGLMLHAIVNPIVLGFLFFATITPMGIVTRWFGKDSLRLRRDPTEPTYWIVRRPPGPAPETMPNQF
jgi:saxitoxin biosynthesis operon SxtJ-like protein